MWTPHRFFTPAEAESLLPEVAPLAVRAQVLYARVEALASPAPARADLVRELARVLIRLDTLGVCVRGLADGLIDFPGRRHGRIVALSWQVGEAGVYWWSPLDTSVRERRPIVGTSDTTWAWYD